MKPDQIKKTAIQPYKTKHIARRFQYVSQGLCDKSVNYMLRVICRGFFVCDARFYNSIGITSHPKQVLSLGDDPND